MLKMRLTSLLFWRNSSTEITAFPSSLHHKKQSFQLGCKNSSELWTIPTYVNFDPDFDVERQLKVKVTEVAPTSFYRNLVEKGPLTSGDFDTKEQWKPPEWLDVNSVQDGLSVVKTHFYSIFFAHIVSLFLIVTIRPLQALLMRTSPLPNTAVHSNKPHASPSFLFTLKILLKLRSIYAELESVGIRTRNSEFSELKKLRQKMREASENFRKFLPPLYTDLTLTDKELLEFKAFRHALDDKCPMTTMQLRQVEKIKTTLNPIVPLSQYDLAILQFLMVGPLLLFPKSFSLNKMNEKQILGFCHLWAFIVHSLGLRDEFNFALISSKAENKFHRQQIATEIQFEIVRFSFLQSDAFIYKLWSILSSNLKQQWLGFVVALNMKCMIHFMSKCLFQIELRKLPLATKVNYYMHKLLLVSSSCWICRNILNAAVGVILSLAQWIYITRHAQSNSVEKNLAASTNSLTRSIRWSSKEDGIAFETVEI